MNRENLSYSNIRVELDIRGKSDVRNHFNIDLLHETAPSNASERQMPQTTSILPESLFVTQIPPARSIKLQPNESRFLSIVVCGSSHIQLVLPINGTMHPLSNESLPLEAVKLTEEGVSLWSWQSCEELVVRVYNKPKSTETQTRVLLNIDRKSHKGNYFNITFLLNPTMTATTDPATATTVTTTTDPATTMTATTDPTTTKKVSTMETTAGPTTFITAALVTAGAAIFLMSWSYQPLS